MKPTSLRAIASRFTASRQAAYSARGRAQELAPRRAPCRTAPRPGPGCRAEAPPAPRPPARHGRSRSASRRRPRTRLSSVSRDTLAIDGSASPRKPKLVTRSIASLGQLRGRVALERQAHFVGRHAAAVVGDLDQLEPARAEAGRRPDLAPASSAFSTSSLSALAGRSTTSPAAMRLMSSGGSLLIDMLTIPSPFRRRRRSTDFSRKFRPHSMGSDQSELSCGSIVPPLDRATGERRGTNVLESLVQMDVARHGDRSRDRQYARLRPRPRDRPQ